MTATATIGDLIPDLTLVDDDGNDVRLRDLTGLTVVLYFYPKDDTPGCTIQACDLRDNWHVFDAIDDVVVYGVSADDVASHQAFRDKYELPFPLLVDAGHHLATALGLRESLKVAGKPLLGTERATVIVNPDGRIRNVHHKVKPSAHVQLLRDELGV